jgi:hypothetical protein
MITIVPPAVMNQSAWHMHTQYGITQWCWLALVPPGQMNILSIKTCFMIWEKMKQEEREKMDDEC